MAHAQFQGWGVGGTIEEDAGGGGGGYGPHVCEVWWAGVQWGARKIKKSDHNSKRERGGEGEKQKNRKISAQKTKSEKSKCFSHLVALGLDPTAFLKRPEGCPLDHRSVQIRAFQPESDLLSTHIGSWPKVELAKMTKKRVLQRVLRYYGGSTRYRCAKRLGPPGLPSCSCGIRPQGFGLCSARRAGQ